jgi:hypothetical protein
VHPTIILKSQGLGRKGHNLYRTTFSDTAALAFPLDPVGACCFGSCSCWFQLMLMLLFDCCLLQLCC